MDFKKELLGKINDGSVKVGIIGLGYVGLPLVLEFCKKGMSVIGFDVDGTKVEVLNSGKSYIHHIKSDGIKSAVESNKFTATADFSRLREADAIIICVPTPLTENREPDMSFIINTAKEIQKYIRRGQLVVLESTTYPGTTEEILQPMFENSAGGNLKVGEDFFLAFSPEREDPNNKDYSTSTIPKVVGGITEACLETAIALYDKIIIRTIKVSSARAAEATKLLENIYRSVNIALVNELKMIFERMDIDIWEVIEAAKTKPFGFNAFYPGPGLGGHCIPIDPFYLSWKAREYDINTRFIELAGEINTVQPYYVVEKLSNILSASNKISLKGSKVLILGASYKKNIDDTRESPTLKLIELLHKKEAVVDYYDPYIPALPKTRKYNYNLKSIELRADKIGEYDAVLISTDHDNVDYKLVAGSAKLIIDTRNIFERLGIKSDKVYKA